MHRAKVNIDNIRMHKMSKNSEKISRYKENDYFNNSIFPCSAHTHINLKITKKKLFAFGLFSIIPIPIGTCLCARLLNS